MMNKVVPIRRKYCVCGRPCGNDVAVQPPQSDSAVPTPPNAPSSSTSSSVHVEKSATTYVTLDHLHTTSSSSSPAPPQDALTLLQLKVRALEKYKSNYELLCSQLAELNTQVGLQLQRHDVDVSTLHSTISTLQSTNATLQQQLQSTTDELHSIKATSEKDREYASSVHKQLTTVSELLKASEARVRDQANDHDDERAKWQLELNTMKDTLAKRESTRQTMEQEISSLQAQVAKAGEDHKLKKKYRAEIQSLKHELHELRDELEQQRSSTRQVKKQLKQTRDERDVIAKQLGSIKVDGTHLTEIIDTLREELVRQEKQTQRWKRMQHDSEIKLSESAKALEDTQAQLIAAQEMLVSKNARVEELTHHVKEWRQRCESHQHEATETTQRLEKLQSELQRVQTECDGHRKQIDVSVKLEEDTAREMERRYRQELDHMKSLLSLNHERTSQSTNDMQVLKHELGTVQELLRKCQHAPGSRRIKSRYRHPEDMSEGDDEREWRLHHQRTQVEKAVLQTAIRDQVEMAYPLASAS